MFHERILFGIRYSKNFHERILFGIRYSEILHERIYSVFGILKFFMNEYYSVFGNSSWTNIFGIRYSVKFTIRCNSDPGGLSKSDSMLSVSDNPGRWPHLKYLLCLFLRLIAVVSDTQTETCKTESFMLEWKIAEVFSSFNKTLSWRCFYVWPSNLFWW